MRSTGLRTVAVVVATCVAAGACTESNGTSEVTTGAAPAADRVPTTSIARSAPTTSTTLAPRPTVARSASRDEMVELLATIANAVAAEPLLLDLISGDLELTEIAQLVGVDPELLALADLTPADIEALAAAVLAQNAAVIEQIAATPPPSIDPGVLAGLLANIPDPNDVVAQITNQLAEELFSALPADEPFVLGPQLQGDLTAVLGRIDPDGLGQAVRDPEDAATVALLLSVVLGENRVLVDQLLAVGLPMRASERSLIRQLLELDASLSDVARQAVLRALNP